MSKRLKLDTDIESFLHEERRSTDMMTGTKARRVKIEEAGDAWLVRFLPVALGKSGLWYVRTAKHWLRKQPITCPRMTHEDLGGNPEAYCPVCEMSAQLRDVQREDVSDIGFRIRANLAYLTYCLVYRMEKKHGGIIDLSAEELDMPWEFQLYKSTFDELVDYFRRGAKKGRPLSILDPDRGNDFWATKTKKGIRFDKEDAAPIFEGDDAEKRLDALLDTIKEPRIKLPTDQELERFATKCEAAAYGEEEPPERGRRSRRSQGYDDEETERGSRRHREEDEEEEPRRGSRRSRRDEEEEDTRSERSERGSRRGRQSEEEAEERPARRGRREEEETETKGRRSRREEDEDQVPGAEVPPREERTTERSSSRRAAPSARGGRDEGDVDENEDEGVTEEEKDHAPPRRSRGSEAAEEEPEGENTEGEEEPPEETRSSRRTASAGTAGGRGTGAKGSSLRDRISRMNRK